MRFGPLLRGIGTRRPRCLLWRNLCDEHIKIDTWRVGHDEETKACVLRHLNVIRVQMETRIPTRQDSFDGETFRCKLRGIVCLIIVAQKHSRPKDSQDTRKYQTENSECSLHITKPRNAELSRSRRRLSAKEAREQQISHRGGKQKGRRRCNAQMRMSHRPLPLPTPRAGGIQLV